MCVRVSMLKCYFENISVYHTIFQLLTSSIDGLGQILDFQNNVAKALPRRDDDLTAFPPP